MSYESVFDEVVRVATEDRTETAFAEAMGESLQTVHNWRSRGIPARAAKKVEALTGISVRRLRPDDWRDYWPDAAPVHRRQRAHHTSS